MYLITRQAPQARQLGAELAAVAIASQELPLVELVPNSLPIPEWLPAINSCELVLFVSPTAITYFADNLTNLNPHLVLAAVGEGSASLLHELSGKKVVHPPTASGIQALIASGGLANYRRIAIVGSDQLNPYLATYIANHGINYELISLYSYRNWGLQHLAEFDKIVSDPVVSGIIISSKIAARFMLECIQHSKILADWFSQTRIISTHSQISTFLQQQGYFNLWECATPSNQAIIELVKGIKP